MQSSSYCSLTDNYMHERWGTHFSFMQRPLDRGSTLTCWSCMLSHIWKNYNHSSVYMMVHPHTGITVCKHFLMRHFVEEGFGHGGFHGPLTSHHWISSSAGYVKDYVYRTSVGDIANLCARTNGRNWCVAKRMLTIHGQNWTASMMWSGPLGVLMLRWIKTLINV